MAEQSLLSSSHPLLLLLLSIYPVCPRQFTRECKTANSTNRADYQPQRDHRPDVILRREALRKAEVSLTQQDHDIISISEMLVKLGLKVC